MLVALARPKAEPFEQALTTLRILLGAESFKPEAHGRADAVWIWPKMWLTLEAKSEQKPDGIIGFDYVRQTNEHLRLLCADRGSYE